MILDRKDRFSRKNIVPTTVKNMPREEYIMILAQSYLTCLKTIYFNKGIPNDNYKKFIWKVLQKGFRIFKYDRHTPYSNQDRKNDLNNLSRFLMTFNEEAQASDFKLLKKEKECYEKMLNVVNLGGNFGNTMVIFILQALEKSVDSEDVALMKEQIDDTCTELELQQGGKRKSRRRKQRRTRKN